METEVKDKLFSSFIKENIEAIAFVDDELRFVSANSAFCRVLGLPSNHRLNQFHISVLPFSNKTTFNDMVEALVQNKLSSFEIETNHQSLDGIEKILQLKMVRTGEHSLFEGGVLVLKDLTQMRQQQQVLKEELAAIKAQNKQLRRYISDKMQVENFAYIASHDMKEPLRMIGNFSQLLARKSREKLDESGQEYLDFILTGVKNMNGFIDDLLIYSRTERAEIVAQEVNLDCTLFLLEREFSNELNNKNATIHTASLPNTINGSKEKIKALFRNLISNSLKFSDVESPTEIRIEAEDKGYCWEFSFSDNGIGIEEDYFEKIFMVFKKLHPKNIYPGTGMGLALCKKIVEQHGGNIWVESEVGKGTTFYFTINKEVV
jgi:PAS domain S-box-containing protein